MQLYSDEVLYIWIVQLFVMTFQKDFVSYLKAVVPDSISLADEIAALLEVSKDSAYRRLRSETPFSIDEAMAVCNRFEIDLSVFFASQYKMVPFRFNRVNAGDLLNYLKGIIEVVDSSVYREAQVILAAQDVPVFHHFEYPLLGGFKLFYWEKSVMNKEAFIGQKYSLDIVHPDIQKASQRLIEKFNKLNTVEIWSLESIEATLSQIVYYAESGQFESDDVAFSLLKDVRQMIDGIQHKAEMSSKTLDDHKNFALYNCEVRIGNNCIVIEHGEKRTVYISHNTFSSISTVEPEFAEDTKNWLDNLMRKSTLINDVSEKHRYQFFKALHARIDQVQVQIEKLLKS